MLLTASTSRAWFISGLQGRRWSFCETSISVVCSTYRWLWLHQNDGPQCNTPVLFKQGTCRQQLCPQWHYLANLTEHICHLSFCFIGSIMWKHAAIHKNGSTQRVTLSSEDDRTAATGHRWSLDTWFLRYVNRQTDSHTRWLQYFTSLLGAM